MSTITFLKGKLRDISILLLLRQEVEQYLLWLFKNAPGATGFLLRYPAYKILFKRLGSLPLIQGNVTIWRTDQLEVGKQFGANCGTYINAVGGIEIGDHVLIGANVIISSGIHPIEGKFPAVFARPVVPKRIVIEDDVWIGANAVILPGVRLAKGTVVGANAVVVRDTEPYSVMAGIPARLLRYRHGKRA